MPKRLWAFALLVSMAALGVERPAEEKAGTRPAKVKITVSKETTYLTGPLNPDGTVNYLAAVNATYGQGVTPENNSAVLLLKALGPRALEEETRALVLEALKIAELPENGKYFISIYRYGYEAFPVESGESHAARERLEASYEKAQKQPVDPRDHPELLGWIERNSAALDATKLAAERQRFFLPRVSSSDPPALVDALQVAYVSRVSDVARGLLVRAMTRSGRGDTPGATSDLLAVHKLARCVGRGAYLIDLLVGLDVENRASAGDLALAAEVELTGAQWRAYLAQLYALPPMPDAADTLDHGERLFDLDFVTLCARDGLEKAYGRIHGDWAIDAVTGEVRKEPPELKIPDVELDWDLFLRMVNKHHDSIVAAAKKDTLAERVRAAAQMQPELMPAVREAVKEYPRLLQFRERIIFLIKATGTQDTAELTRAVAQLHLYGESLSSLARLFELVEIARTRSEVAKVAIALRAYHAEAGAYPKKLDELSPKYVRKVPVDAFSQRALVYRRVDVGRILYSVGKNMKDDGGKAQSAGGDDIVVHLRDPVRPKANR